MFKIIWAKGIQGLSALDRNGLKPQYAAYRSYGFQGAGRQKGHFTLGSSPSPVLYSGRKDMCLKMGERDKETAAFSFVQQLLYSTNTETLLPQTFSGGSPGRYSLGKYFT